MTEDFLAEANGKALTRASTGGMATTEDLSVSKLIADECAEDARHSRKF